MLDRYIIAFFIYSFFGYLCEVTYCSIPKKRFVNRGFLYGPYLPIYGFGGLIVIIFLEPLNSYPVLVFILALLLTSILEYFTSWLLEKLFSVKLWDYSKHRVNINGRVCLLNSTLFGIMGIVLEYIVNPVVSSLIDKIPDTAIHTVSLGIVSLVAVDTTLSVMKMIHFREGLKRIREMRAELNDKLKVLYGEGKAELADELKKRLEENLEKYRIDFRKRYSRIVKANPSITARNEEIKAQIAIYTDWLEERRELRKKYKNDLKKIDDEHLDMVRKSKHD